MLKRILIYTSLFCYSVLSFGQSGLSSMPMISPVKGYLSSGFGYRISPFTKKKTYHEGLDIVAPTGEPVYAPADGVVTAVGRIKRLGKYIILSHGNGIVTKYGHLKSIKIREGQRVKRDAVIGSVGMTGRTTGSHLHYEILINGKNVDPRKFIIYDPNRDLETI